MSNAGSRVIVDIASPVWDATGGVDLQAIVTRAVDAALSGADERQAVEVGVRLTDDAEIRALNREWRDRDSATNVLAFPLDEDRPDADGVTALGDVVVAYETLVAEADEDGKTLPDHLSHLIVHGTLHLLGFDHEATDEAEAMEALERRVLATLDVADPYADSEAA